MDVRLAGRYLDRDLILSIRSALEQTAHLPAGLSPGVDAARAEAAALLERDNWTPETLSAAYARISRDPRPVTDLRGVAREEVDAARRSNETIIFGSAMHRLRSMRLQSRHSRSLPAGDRGDRADASLFLHREVPALHPAGRGLRRGRGDRRGGNGGRSSAPAGASRMPSTIRRTSDFFLVIESNPNSSLEEERIARWRASRRKTPATASCSRQPSSWARRSTRATWRP